MKPCFSLAALLLGALLPLRGLAVAEPTPGEVRATIAKATAFMRSIANEGGYLWRYSPDLKERAGEEIATPTQIWVQPPGTPSVGMAFLRVHEITGDARYLEAARAAAISLVAGQLESGGWDYFVDFDPVAGTKAYRRSDTGRIAPAEAAKRENTSTYDDNNSQAALRFLLAIADVTHGSDDPRDIHIREARDYGLAKLVAAQRPNGGWAPILERHRDRSRGLSRAAG